MLEMSRLILFFTKPLQGHLFRRFRDVILGHCHLDILRNDFIFPSEERVGEERSDTDATSTQYTVSSNGTNANTAENVKTEAPTEKVGTNEPDKDTNAATWVEVVKQPTKKTNNEYCFEF